MTSLLLTHMFQKPDLTCTIPSLPRTLLPRENQVRHQLRKSLKVAAHVRYLLKYIAYVYGGFKSGLAKNKNSLTGKFLKEELGHCVMRLGPLISKLFICAHLRHLWTNSLFPLRPPWLIHPLHALADVATDS